MVEVPGGRLWTATSGQGVPLLLCHGGPGAYDYLAPVAKMLEDQAEVHRFDQRGGGRSVADGPWTVSALVSDMEALRHHWGHERWLVGGHSWGAHLALFYGLAHPDRTLGLVFMNGTGLRWGWGTERRANRMRRLSGDEQAEVERLDRDLRAGESLPARERLRELLWLADFADREVAGRSPRYDAHPPDPLVVAALERDWQRMLDGVDGRLGQLDLPAVVLHGEADPIGESGPSEVARLLRGTFIVLRGVGHIPWLEESNGMRDELRSFVAQFDGASRNRSHPSSSASDIARED